MKNKKPIKFVQNSIGLIKSWVSGENCKVVVEDFKYEERGGEVGDIYYSIVIKEYKHFAPQLIMQIGEGTDTTLIEKKVLDSGKEMTRGVRVEGSGDVFRTMGIKNGQFEVGNLQTKTGITGTVKNLFNSNGIDYAEVLTDNGDTLVAKTSDIGVIASGGN